MELRGKVAIVTGASRGIGKAFALGLAEAGADVVIAARTETPRKRVPGAIGETASEVEAQGVRALAVKCDVADEASVQEMLSQTMDKFGRVDILINNAAAATYQPFMETPVTTWDKIIQTNIRGTFLCCRAVLPHMITQHSGSIINISSTGGTTIFSMTMKKEQAERTLIGIAYGASKAAIERMTVGLAAEMGRHNIAVNCLKPARPVITEGMRVNLPDSDWSQWVEPTNMARAAVFLAQQDASGVTGEIALDDELILRHGL